MLPFNVSRLLGQIGGYAWSYTTTPATKSASVTAHLYIPNSLRFSIGADQVLITQQTQYPSHGHIDFTLESSAVHLDLKLRIPAWATTSHDLHPPCPNATLHKGYLSLPAEYLAKHKSFRLSFPLKFRWLAQHPFRNQHTLSCARGPVIYCVEDVDNTWVEDHFKSLYLDYEGTWEEREVISCEITGERYVALTLRNGARRLDVKKIKGLPMPMIDAKELQSGLEASKAVGEVKFVPYWFRGNRGAKGHVRVGLKR